jgi:hypothetical protein
MPDRARLSRAFRFPAEVIAHAVRLGLRFPPTYEMSRIC